MTIDALTRVLRDPRNAADADIRAIRTLLEAGVRPDRKVRAALRTPLTYETVVEAMSDLEKLAERDAEVASMLMVGLYPLASDLMAHDVCDAIELWFENRGTPRLDTLLQALEESNSIPDLHEKLVFWRLMLAQRRDDGRRDGVTG